MAKSQEDRLMMTRKSYVIGTTIEQVRRGFERWRKTRPPSSPILEAL